MIIEICIGVRIIVSEIDFVIFVFECIAETKGKKEFNFFRIIGGNPNKLIRSVVELFTPTEPANLFIFKFLFWVYYNFHSFLE